MAESQRRFPYWLLACSAILVIVAAVLGFIETVARQGTIVGRYERIKERMSCEETARIMGTSSFYPHRRRSIAWKEGPVYVVVEFQDDDHIKAKETFSNPDDTDSHVGWHVRRWCEKAWAAIHGPRR